MLDAAISDPRAESRYQNRELSWLDFDRRVLEESTRDRHPLLEQLKFVAISDTNLDEFVMVRLAGLLEQLEADVTERSTDGLTAAEQLALVRPEIRRLMARQREILRERLLPQLEANGIRVLPLDRVGDDGRAALDRYFETEIFPICTPLGFDPGRPFPFISNQSVNLAVVLDDAEAGRRFARVKIPTVAPRLIPVPSEASHTFVWLDDLIIANLHKLFPGMTVREVHAFRVLRDADVEIRELEAGDLLESVRVSLQRRRFGEAIAIQIHPEMPDYLRMLLVEKLDIYTEDVYVVEGPLGLGALWELVSVNRPDLKNLPFAPRVPAGLRVGGDIFATIRERDILLHHPFDSFDPIVTLLNHAADDPAVLAIKQTLYRVGQHSPIVDALRRASERGKQVAVLVELKARFDEGNNIEWARALERAGCHVTYGLVGLKTHAKMALIVRRERDGLRRYVHLGTGNYNPSTARLYTDLGLLTCRDDIGADVSELFNVITGYSRQTAYRKLLVAPHGLRDALVSRIDREIAAQREHGNGRIILKVNHLVDTTIVDAIYRAVEAGVDTDLIVRGMNVLRPSVLPPDAPLRVRSVLGRFLEHTRIYYFGNGGKEECFIGSADLMPRNLDYRVEVVTPIEDPALLRLLRDGVLDAYLRDQQGSSLLGRDDQYHLVGDGFCAQTELLTQAANDPDAAQPVANPLSAAWDRDI